MHASRNAHWHAKRFEPAPRDMGQEVKRPENVMPAFVREAIDAQGLGPQFEKRPWYQRNDYVGWISSAKLEATRVKRLAQMLEELRAGDLYMKMSWRHR
jgi:uncharacterized protein YdeI (YjbR/CyaY-like superfamily)